MSSGLAGIEWSQGTEREREGSSLAGILTGGGRMEKVGQKQDGCPHKV